MPMFTTVRLLTGCVSCFRKDFKEGKSEEEKAKRKEKRPKPKPKPKLEDEEEEGWEMVQRGQAVVGPGLSPNVLFLTGIITIYCHP